MKKQVLSLLVILLMSLTMSAQYILNEGFEGDNLPSGWITHDGGNNSGTWEMDTYSPYMGEGHLTLDCYEDGATESGKADDWMVTPQITVKAGDVLSVFAMSSSDSYKDNLNIMISKTGTEIADFTITIEAIAEVPSLYTRYEYVLSDIDGISADDNIYIAFHTNSNGSYMNLDEVKVGPASIQINEDFENGIPASWATIDGGNNNMTWSDTLTGGFDGTNGVWVDCYESGLEMDGRADDWLITPSFKFIGTDVLSFWLYGNEVDYPDTVYVALSQTGTAIEDFDIFLDTIITTTDWSKYQYEFEQVSGTVTNGDNLHAGIWALSNGSRVFLDNLRVGEMSQPKVFDTYAISANKIAVIYDAEVDATTVVKEDFAISGSAELTITEAVSDPENGKVVLMTTSADMAADNTLDKLTDTGSGIEIEFYAGITPIKYTSITHPDGVIESGYNATFKGVVAAVASGRVWLADATGAYNGINTYDLSGDEPLVGDEILIYGNLDHYDNQSEIYPAYLVENISLGNDVYAPAVITGADISLTNAADENPAEQYEGVLVKVIDLTVISFDGEYYLCSDDGANNFYLGDRFGLFEGDFATAVETGKTYHVTGIITGRSGEYLLAPRNADDIELANAIKRDGELTFSVYPNPFSDNIQIVNGTNIKELKLSNIIGQEIMHITNLESRQLSFSLAPLEKGVYIISVITEDNAVQSTKIIKN